MKISARVQNSLNHHQAVVATDGRSQGLHIEPKPGGFGSSVNGGELLFLALATCFCNDIYDITSGGSRPGYRLAYTARSSNT